MSLFKLAGQTGKAFKSLLKAMGSDSKSAGRGFSNRLKGMAQGAKYGDIAEHNSYLQKELKQKSSNALAAQKAQALHDQAKYEKLKTGATKIIDAHKRKEKIIGGLGIAGTASGLGLAGLNYRNNEKKEQSNLKKTASIKEIALELDDVELYKIANELETEKVD